MRERKREWERRHPARRYLIPVEVRDQVAALAEALMENVDSLACVLFDYADDCHRRGALKFHPRLNPQGRKHTLTWEAGDGKLIQPLYCRGASRRKTDTHPRSLKGQTAAYRLGDERHARLKLVASGYNLRLADVLAAYYRYSLQAYRDGRLKIRRQPVMMQLQVEGFPE